MTISEADENFSLITERLRSKLSEADDPVAASWWAKALRDTVTALAIEADQTRKANQAGAALASSGADVSRLTST